METPMVDFDNNWDEIQSAPDSAFKECSFQDMMFRASSWSLPSSVMQVLRVEDSEGKVCELVCRNKQELKRTLTKLNKADVLVTHYDDERLYCNYDADQG